jgi:hypothetical protein
MLGDYRFKRRSRHINQKKETHWVCNKSDKGCKAKLTTLNDAIIKMYNVHDHEVLKKFKWLICSVLVLFFQRAYINYLTLWAPRTYISVKFYNFLSAFKVCQRQPMWRSGENTRLLRQRLRIRFPHSANICVHEHVCLYWVWVFLCIICKYLQKKRYISIYLSVI